MVKQNVLKKQNWSAPGRTLTTTTYGYTCPNMDDNFLPDEIMGMPRLWHSSEGLPESGYLDHLLDKEAQKPVMVFLPAGIFFRKRHPSYLL